MKLIKRLTSALIICLLCFAICTNISLASGNKGEKLNVMFVMDASKSMLKSDPQNIRGDAIKLFIDMCRGKGDNIGLTAYGSKIVKTVEPKSINSFGDRESLKNLIRDIPQSDSTDIGLGIIQGINNLEKGAKEGCIPILILLSDGRNDPERAIGESNKDIAKAIQMSKERGCRIYTIGLNADGSVDVNLLKKIANETRGKSFIINTAKDLPLIFGEIFADSSQLKMISKGNIKFNGDFQNVEIDIPNSNVVEANISIMSQGKMEFKISDSSGSVKSIPSDKIYSSYSGKYSLIKLLTPQRGKWVLGIKGQKGQSADVSLIYNYELGLELSKIPNGEYKPQDVINICAYLTSSGQKLEDMDFYKGLKGKIIVYGEKGDLAGEFNMDNLSNEFKGTCKIPSEGNYQILVRVDGSSFYRESEPVKLTIAKSAQTVDTKVEPIKPEPKPAGATNWNIYLIAGILLVLITAICVILLLKKNGRRKISNIKVDESIELSGRIMVTIKDEASGISFPPIVRDLQHYKSGISIVQVVPELLEYKGTEKIRIISDRADSNSDEALRAEKSRKGITCIKIGDKRRIKLTGSSKILFVEYMIE